MTFMFICHMSSREMERRYQNMFHPKLRIFSLIKRPTWCRRHACYRWQITLNLRWREWRLAYLTHDHVHHFPKACHQAMLDAKMTIQVKGTQIRKGLFWSKVPIERVGNAYTHEVDSGRVIAIRRAFTKSFETWTEVRRRSK